MVVSSIQSMPTWAVDLGGVVVAEEAVALQPARGHQDEDAEGRVAEAEALGRLGSANMPTIRSTRIDVALVDASRSARPLRVVGDLFEGRTGCRWSSSRNSV